MKSRPAKRPHDALLTHGLLRAGGSGRHQILLDATWMGSIRRDGFGVVPQTLRKSLKIRDSWQVKRDATSALALAKAGVLINHASDELSAIHMPKVLGLFFTRDVVNHLIDLGRGRKDSVETRNILYDYVEISLKSVVKTFMNSPGIKDVAWRETELVLASLYAIVCLDRVKSAFLVEKLSAISQVYPSAHPVLERHLQYLKALIEIGDEPRISWDFSDALVETVGVDLYAKHVDLNRRENLFLSWVNYNREPLRAVEIIKRNGINSDAVLEMAYKRLGTTEYGPEQLVMHHAAWIIAGLALYKPHKKRTPFLKYEELRERLKKRIGDTCHRNAPVIRLAQSAIDKRLTRQ